MLRRATCAGALITLLLVGRAAALQNGEPVPAGAYPAVGVLDDPKLPSLLRCTGSLIAPQWVVTAAHCNVLQGGRFTAGGTTQRIDAVESAPGNVGTANDVALFHLATPSTVAPLKIAGPAERDLWAAGVTGTLLGDGAVDDLFTPPPGMLQTRARILSDAECSAVYPETGLPPEPLGTTPRVYRADQSTCEDLGAAIGKPGDSGGPLLVPAPGGDVRIVSVTNGYAQSRKEGDPLMSALVAGDRQRPWLMTHVPEAIGAPGVVSPVPALRARLTLRRLPGRRVRLLVRGTGIERVRFTATGRRASVDYRAPFRRVVRLRRAPVRLRAVVSGAGTASQTLRRTYRLRR